MVRSLFEFTFSILKAGVIGYLFGILLFLAGIALLKGLFT